MPALPTTQSLPRDCALSSPARATYSPLAPVTAASGYWPILRASVFPGPGGAALVQVNGALVEAATGLVAGDEYGLVHVDWPGMPALLQDGPVDVLFQLCTPVCASWMELSTGRDVTIIGYNDEMMARAKTGIAEVRS